MLYKPKEDSRFIIKYTLGTFSTFVEVFSNFTCKTYETIYSASTTEYTMAELISMAEEEAINKYIEKEYNGKSYRDGGYNGY